MDSAISFKGTSISNEHLRRFFAKSDSQYPRSYPPRVSCRKNIILRRVLCHFRCEHFRVFPYIECEQQNDLTGARISTATNDNPKRTLMVELNRSRGLNVLKKFLLLAVVLASPLTFAACLSTEAEPNNSDTVANAGLCSGTSVTGSISSSSDYDWYKLDVTGAGTRRSANRHH